ncbi:hypothetical protein [Xylophilus ampelinus]|uniref:hypothetical protein n=1 Tax=Xylophilus ampelinus TaxID=54067 RepID=UPI0011B84233|nr:hypothetical protein [Xylophilus ampelinus]MCS4510182.1 hypothetical protein [Xylophilus ampelinus]
MNLNKINNLARGLFSVSIHFNPFQTAAVEQIWNRFFTLMGSVATSGLRFETDFWVPRVDLRREYTLGKFASYGWQFDCRGAILRAIACKGLWVIGCVS